MTKMELKIEEQKKELDKAQKELEVRLKAHSKISMIIKKFKAEKKAEMEANRQEFSKRFEECKKYYQNKIQDLKGSEKAQVAKEHSLMEKLNQVLEKSMTEKESKIEELRNELDMAQKQNESLQSRNQMLSQVGFHLVDTL